VAYLRPDQFPSRNDRPSIGRAGHTIGHANAHVHKPTGWPAAGYRYHGRRKERHR
jgi:hypothetical protein